MIRRWNVAFTGTAVLLILLLACVAALANGHARTQAEAAATAAAGQSQAGGARGTSAGPPVSTARFTLEFVNAEIIDVLQALATQSGVNIAASGSVTGTTTLRLRDVTLEQALNIVTRLNGLDYAWVDAAYVVGTPEEVNAMRVADLRTSVVALQHIQPAYARDILARMTPEVTVSTQEGVSSILLLGTEASLAKAERALAEIDVPPVPGPPTTSQVGVRYLRAEEMAEMIAQVLPEVTIQPGTQENSLLITADSLQWNAVRSLMAAADVPPAPTQATQAVYYVKYITPTELRDSVAALVPDVTISLAPRSFTPVIEAPTGGVGGTADLLAAPQLGEGGGAGAAYGESEGAPVTALIVSGAPYTVDRALGLLAQFDEAPRQVHITAMITEVRREDVMRLGIDWGPSEDAGLGQTGVPLVIGEVMAEAPPSLTPVRGFHMGRLQRNILEWNASIRALEEQGRANILSNPSVTTLDGRQTTLHTGETYYYEVAVAAATTGGIVKDVRTFEVGISLIVNPRINNEDEVTLTISPTVAALLGTSEFNLPVVTERAVVTTVRVRSGETAVIAGLVSDEEQVMVTKIPFLGDIPLLGELFRHRERRPSHSEILIFVTPTILDNLDS